jgi:metal-dependent amidase/aminoacylase/carboxypeptidase family protein
MIGTIRTLDAKMREKLLKDLDRTVVNIAEANNCTAELILEPGIPINYNNPALTEQMLPTLRRTAGEPNVILGKASTGAEDFAFFSEKIPGFFVFLGGMAKGEDPLKAPGHHTPDFKIDESSMLLGVRTYCNLALDWLAARPSELPKK